MFIEIRTYWNSSWLLMIEQGVALCHRLVPTTLVIVSNMVVNYFHLAISLLM